MLKQIDVVALALCVMGLVFCGVGLAIPQWIVYPVGSGDAYLTAGLWRLCEHYLNSEMDRCVSLPAEAIDVSVRAVRALVLLGMVCELGTLVATVIVKISDWAAKNAAIWTLAAAGLSFAAGLSLLIGVMIYAHKAKTDGNLSILHSGFELAVVASVLSFVSSGLLLHLRKSVSP